MEEVAQKQPRSRRDTIMTWMPLILVLVGILVLLYPVLATQHNNAEQQRIAHDYAATVDSSDPSVIEGELRSAQAYNRDLEVLPILDPWLEGQRPNTPQYQAYLEELDFDTMMGRVVIPQIHVSLPIYHGTEPSTLNKGVGHLFGTSLPVGGASTHSALTAHTGLGSATLFDNLTELAPGSVFYVNVLGETLKYEVTDIQTVLPEQTQTLRKVAGRDLVTLITCTPYGVNSHRLLVTGERVAIDPEAAAVEEAQALPGPLQPWMVGVLVTVGVVSAIVLIVLVRAFLRSRRREDAEEKSLVA